MFEHLWLGRHFKILVTSLYYILAILHRRSKRSANGIYMQMEVYFDLQL